MANLRTPKAKAKITGADAQNPHRFKNRSEPESGPLGKASVHIIDNHQLSAWSAFLTEIPWLTEADRTLVEIASNLRGRLFSGDEVGVQAIAQLRMCIAQMGGTPADRSKVSLPDKGEKDSTSKYFS